MSKYEEVSCTDTSPSELRWAFPAPGVAGMGPDTDAA